MKKYIPIFILLIMASAILLFINDANEILTYQAPSKYKTTNPKETTEVNNNNNYNNNVSDNINFQPYMNELTRKIKSNWDPPSGNKSKKTVLLFGIAKDGSLLNVKVIKSAGQLEDEAAITAVKLSAPFNPLPSNYKKSSVDIQFDFDYNVIKDGR